MPSNFCFVLNHTIEHFALNISISLLHINSHKVSILKGISWRVIGTLDTILLSFIFTGQFLTAVKIGGIELFTKILLYYLHERAWIFFHIGKRTLRIDNGIIVYEDKHWRSIVKSISWRFIGTLDTIVIAYFVTGEISTAFEIGFTEVFTKMLLFYLHERFWNRITRKGNHIQEPLTAMSEN